MSTSTPSPSESTTPHQYSKFGQTFINYGSYHYDLVNKIIHIICIPIITATLFALINMIPLHFQVAGYTLGAFHIAVVLGVLFYLSISVGAAVLMGGLIVLGTLAWNWLLRDYKESEVRNVVIGLFVVGWIVQFIGHGVFQKRKPALLDSITQVFSAPLFVVIEILYMLGIKIGDVDAWMKQIQINVKEYRAQNAKGKVQ